MKKIRVLVVDDSALMRMMLKDLINSQPDMEVIATAKNGKEAIEKTLQLSPDVVIMDVRMPVMDGLTALKEIMRKKPTPVIMFSALTKKDSEIAIQALNSGAVDYVPKPGGTIAINMKEVADELINKIRHASRVSVSKLRMLAKPSVLYEVRKLLGEAKKNPPAKIAVVIAASTGGPSAIREVVSRLKRNLPAGVLIVQHMPPIFTRMMAERLNKFTHLSVKEAENGDVIREGNGYVAPGDYHMGVKGRVLPRIEIFKGPKINGVRPSADPTLKTAAEIFRDRTVAVILTGIGSDGKVGAEYVKKYGGYVIAQDEETSVVWGMPGAVVKAGLADYVLPVHKIGDKVNELVEEIARSER